MAISLKFNGVTSYLGIDSAPVTTFGDFCFRFSFLYEAGNNQTLVGNPDTSDDLIRFNTATSILFKSGSLSTTLTLLSSLVAGQRYIFKFRRSVNTLDLTDDYGTSLITAPKPINTNFDLYAFGRFSAGQYWQGDLGFFEFYSDTDCTTPVNKWDASASTHGTGATILTDTIGGNNASGIGFRTDGLQWVSSDVDISITLNDITVKNYIDALPLQRFTNLAVDDVSFNVEVDGLTLQRFTNVLIDGLSINTEVDTLTPQRFTQASMNDVSLKVTVDQLPLQRFTSLLLQDIKVNTYVDNLIVSFGIILEFDDITINNEIDSLSVQRFTGVSVKDVVIESYIDNLQVQRYTNLNFDDVSIKNYIDNLTLITGFMPEFGVNDLHLISKTIQYELTSNTQNYNLTSNTKQYKVSRK